ncbi:MAG: GntR family transcriptional regulator, partial [Oscillospiraceae bacterium]|nr:GntR family transcriptional regulator [Oscillospiraceae bacterium]
MLLETDDRSLRIRVFNAIENAILDGEYRDGDSLNELKLSKELGVSRTPVREALMQLELEGLVRNVPNKGAVVIGVTEQDIHDIYEIRIRIEGLAARLCAENITDDELRAL